MINPHVTSSEMILKYSFSRILNLMKIESQIHLKLFDAVTKYSEKMLSHRQMMTSQKWLHHHLTMTQHFLSKYLVTASNNISLSLILAQLYEIE